jgi:hypothetical protein
LFDGLRRGVLIAESIHPNKAHIGGRGINMLTGAETSRRSAARHSMTTRSGSKKRRQLLRARARPHLQSTVILPQMLASICKR